MRRRHDMCVGIALLVLLLLGPLGFSPGAQTNAGVASLPLEASSSRAPWLDPVGMEILLSEGLLLLLMALGCGLLFVGMEAFDSWRERGARETARLRAGIAAALQRDLLLKDLPVTPIVHQPLWGRSGATVELRGQVPTPWLRYALLRTAELEAARSTAVCHIDDHLVIAPSRKAS